jgi:hypothetical protein
VTVKLVERSLTEQLALNHEAEIANPTLHTKHVTAALNLSSWRRWPIASGASTGIESPTAADKMVADSAVLAYSLSTKLLEEKAALVIVYLGFLKEGLPMLVALNTPAPLYRSYQALRLIAQREMLGVQLCHHALFVGLGGQIGIVVTNLG